MEPSLGCLGHRWARGAIGRMFWPLGAAGGFGVFLLFASFRHLLGATGWTHTISLLFGRVHFIIKLEFVFPTGILLDLSVLDGIGAGNDIVQELVLLLAKERARGSVKKGPCFYSE